MMPPRLSVLDRKLAVNMVNREPSVFSRILRGEIPSEIVVQTDDVFVIRDIAPQAPLHLLVIPKTEQYRDVTELADGDPALLAHLIEVAASAARAAGSPDFRLVFNTGAAAGQTVFHVHAHVLGSVQDGDGGALAESGLAAGIGDAAHAQSDAPPPVDRESHGERAL